MVAARLDFSSIASSAARSNQIAYYTIELLGAFLLAGLLLVFYLAKKHRHPTLISLIVALIIDQCLHCVSMGQESNPTLPIAITATVTSISFIMISLGSFVAIIVRMWAVCVLERSTLNQRWERVLDLSLLIVPWGLGLLMLVASTIATALGPVTNIGPTVLGPYNLDGRVTYVSRAFAVLYLIIALVFEVWTIIAVVRRPSRLNDSANTSQTTSHVYTAPSPFDAGFRIRVLVFGIYASGGIIFAAVSLVSSTLAPAYYQAIAGLMVFSIFGSSRDILQFVRILPSNDFAQSQILTSTVDVNSRNANPNGVNFIHSHSKKNSRTNAKNGGVSFSVERRVHVSESEISLDSMETGKTEETGSRVEGESGGEGFQVELMKTEEGGMGAGGEGPRPTVRTEEGW